MAYGDSPLIGSTIDPRLFAQDFSGYADAARTNAMGFMGLAGGVGQATGDYLKEQKQAKNALKASQAQIQAAMTLFPDQKPMLEQVHAQLQDENTPLSQRAAIGGQVSELINMGVGERRYQAEQGLRERGMALQERGQNMQEQEGNMRMYGLGQQMQTAEQERATQAATKDAIGGALLDQYVNLLPAEMSSGLRQKAGGMTNAQKFDLANAIRPLIPNVDNSPAETREFDTPQGKVTLQRAKGSSEWTPIQVSPEVTGFIANLEGFNPNAYSDSGQTSIGFGTRAKPGEKSITREEAAKRLNDELSAHAKNVDDAAKEFGADLNENQRKALISFDYNTGAGRSVIQRYAKDPNGMVAKMQEYVKLDKNDSAPAKGLVNRRAAEIGLFQTPVVGFKPNVVDEKEQAATQKTQLEVENLRREQAGAAQKAAGAADQSQQFLTKLEALEKHPGFSNLFGSNVGIPTWVAGSSGADAKAMFESIQGTGFLEAVQALKGMGALTEAEGQKATASFLGLSTSMSEAAAKKRLQELREVVQKGIQKAQAANPATVGTPAAATPANSPAVDPFTAATQRLNRFVTQ